MPKIKSPIGRPNYGKNAPTSRKMMSKLALSKSQMRRGIKRLVA